MFLLGRLKLRESLPAKFVMVVFLLSDSRKMSGFKTFLSANVAFFAVQCGLVCCDITDGNAEHLKREHSLMKPYQGDLLTGYILSAF